MVVRSRTSVLVLLCRVRRRLAGRAKPGWARRWIRRRCRRSSAQFVEQMRGAALVGRFTIRGREDRAATPDRYDIYSVDKVGEDQWRFNAKIGETGRDAADRRRA